MPKALNLTNQRFGKLVAIKRGQSKNKHTYWICQCDCGNMKEIQTIHLTTGVIKSCGCACGDLIGNERVNKSFQPKQQICPLCQRKFINRQRTRYYCYDCIPEGLPAIERLKRKSQIVKHMLVQYKGGKCEKCGYNKCEAALEFHHKDPKEKDFQVSHKALNYNEGIEKLYREADKCILLCANCHREIHNELNK